MAGDEDHTANPGGMFADRGDADNAKSKDWRQGASMGGTPAQDHAERRTTGDQRRVDARDPSKGTPHVSDQ